MDLSAIVLGLTGFFGITMTSMLLYEIRRTRESIESLNEKVAVVISKVETHESRIDRLESRYLT